ncbi:MAG: hypothetical protein ACC707_03145 [Thiohalomonadales bacterium]
MKISILTINILSMFFAIAMASSVVYAESSSAKSTEKIISVVTPNSDAVGARPGVTVTAEIAESVGVIKIVLFYRAMGASDYRSKTMHADKNGEYRYVIDQEELDATGLEYYLEVSDFSGNTLLHGYANSPLAANFADGLGNNAVAVRNYGVHTSPNNNIVSSQGQNQSLKGNEPLWKNKWLWIGVGVLAAAAIANNNSGDEPNADPGYSLVVEGSQPEAGGQ